MQNNLFVREEKLFAYNKHKTIYLLLNPETRDQGRRVEMSNRRKIINEGTKTKDLGMKNNRQIEIERIEK